MHVTADSLDGSVEPTDDVHQLGIVRKAAACIDDAVLTCEPKPGQAKMCPSSILPGCTARALLSFLSVETMHQNCTCPVAPVSLLGAVNLDS
jgi:hypothetical protein